MQKHIKSVHEKIKDHNCLFCDKSFFHRGHLKDHIKCVHEKIKDHACQFCDKSFGLKSDLQKHIKRIHEKIKVHKCQFCDKSFAQENILNRHIQGVHKFNEGKKEEKSSGKKDKNMIKQTSKLSMKKVNNRSRFGNKSPQKAKTNLKVKPKRQNDHEDENLMMTNEYESLKKDNIGGLLQNQDEKFNDFKELFQQEMDKKLDELKELFQQQNENLQHEIGLLKNEVLELKENVKATNDTRIINPSDYQFEDEIIILNKEVKEEVMKKEVKEEVIDEVTIKDEAKE